MIPLLRIATTRNEVLLHERFPAQRLERRELGMPRQFDSDDSAGAYLRLEIEPRESGCLFRFTDRMGPAVDASKLFGADVDEVHRYQPGGVGTHWSGVVSGYHGFVDALESHITGVEVQFDYGAMSKVYGDLLDQWHPRRD